MTNEIQRESEIYPLTIAIERHGIRSMIRLKWDGSTEIEGPINFDAAARSFWSAVFEQAPECAQRVLDARGIVKD